MWAMDAAFHALGVGVVSAAAGIVLAVVTVGVVTLLPPRWRAWL
ncbi:hypothetical protein [Bradyrhizobium cenepequi]